MSSPLAGEGREGAIRLIKKGREGPGLRTATSRGWDHPPPAVRFDTRISETKVRTSVPLFRGAIYKHCVRAGQAKCGNNGTPSPSPVFKLAFEIGMPRINAILYHS